MADLVLDERDRWLIAALQYDGRATPERVAAVLDLPPRLVGRRLRALLRDGTVRVTAVPPRDPADWISLLRVKVLRGTVEAIAAALARRPDVPFVDISSTGDEVSAIAVSREGARGRVLFDRVAAANAVTQVTAQTVLRVYAQAHQWRLPLAGGPDLGALAPAVPAASLVPVPEDETEWKLRAVLEQDARVSAAALAARSGVPETTVRRRLRAMTDAGTLVTSVLVAPARLGLSIDANLIVTLPPDRLDAAARALARHPAVHGVLAMTGAANLLAAVWLRDLDALYELITGDLAALGASAVETVLVGTAVKRPGMTQSLP